MTSNKVFAGIGLIAKLLCQPDEEDKVEVPTWHGSKDCFQASNVGFISR